MFNLILFYVLAGQFHTDVSYVTTVYRSQHSCAAGAGKIIETLKKAHPEVSKIEWTCTEQ